MLVSAIVTNITDSTSIKYINNLVFCECIYPINANLPTNTLLMQTCFSLDEIHMIINDDTVKSTMDINEFRKFTKKRNIVFDACISFNENDIIQATSIVFTDAIKKI